MSENMKLWDSVCETDPGTTKEVNFGRKFTAIDAYAQIKRATEIWGPYGGVWGLTDISHTPVEGTTMMLVSSWFKYPEGKFPITSSIFFMSEKGSTDDDFAKKVETDLITKALSRLGFNADVFMGKFDDNRYVQAMKKKFEQVSPEPVNKTKVENTVKTLKRLIDADTIEETHEQFKTAYRDLTHDEKLLVGELMSDKAPDSKKMYKSLAREYLDYRHE